MASLFDYLAVAPQYLLPQHLLSRLVKRLSHVEHPAVRSALIQQFLAHYDVNLAEAATSAPSDYAHFNAFFTRHLKAGARPITSKEHGVCSPADGILSQFGTIDNGTIIQAKGRCFGVSEFLAERPEHANRYENGSFATVYLAPHNYHRVHAPVDGRVIHVKYVPGKLFSVNSRTARTVPRLFARNERVMVEIQSDNWGRVTLVLVGAMLVASIGLEFFDMESFIYKQNQRQVSKLPLKGELPALKKGESVGWFNMGSTVVLLFENPSFEFSNELIAGQKIKMGELLGSFNNATDREVNG
ncbi:MAG: archaetidylserine decarboxylase [Gammaproteobacteria bacterium]